MTLIIPEGYASVLHSISLDGDPEPYAITHAVATPVADGAGAVALAGQLHAAFEAEMAPVMSAALTVNETVVKVGSADPGEYYVGAASTPFTGGGGSTNLVPQNTAFLIHKRTGHSGRTGRGRMYLPGVQETNVSSAGVVTPAWVTSMNTALDDWRTAIIATAGATTTVLLHDSDGAGAGLEPYEVFTFSCDALVATQRRRLRK